MSGASDDRWRPARGQQNPRNQNRPNNHQQRNQSHDGAQGNVWQNLERSSRDGVSHGLLQEKQVPEAGFNAQEIRDFLKRSYSSLSVEDAKAACYKAPAGQANSAKSGSPWGTKPNSMSNGKDFFLELRKQVSALQQGAERAGG